MRFYENQSKGVLEYVYQKCIEFRMPFGQISFDFILIMQGPGMCRSRSRRLPLLVVKASFGGELRHAIYDIYNTLVVNEMLIIDTLAGDIRTHKRSDVTKALVGIATPLSH